MYAVCVLAGLCSRYVTGFMFTVRAHTRIMTIIYSNNKSVRFVYAALMWPLERKSSHVFVAVVRSPSLRFSWATNFCCSFFVSISLLRFFALLFSSTDSSIDIKWSDNDFRKKATITLISLRFGSNPSQSESWRSFKSDSSVCWSFPPWM